MSVSGLRVFVAMSAVLMGRSCVFLSFLVLTDIVKMCRSKVMMRRCVVVSSCLKVMLARRVLC
jgi:hypothetical protein